MRYILPNAVVSPRRQFTLIAVLDDGKTDDNPTGEDSVSVALGRWRNSDGVEEPVLGIRWNGNEANRIGNPQSRGLPTWFIVPRQLRRSILDQIPLSDAKQALLTEAFEDFGAGPDGTGWICDECGHSIRKAKDGVVEWIDDHDDEKGHWKGQRMRVVHHFLASPLKKKRGEDGCYIPREEQRRLGISTSWTYLEGFLGPDGLTRMLELIADHEVPTEEVIETVKRLHVPRYERARPYFSSAIADGVIEPNVKCGFYCQEDLETILKRYVETEAGANLEDGVDRSR